MNRPVPLTQFLLFTAFLLFCSCQRNQNADELIIGKIWTGNPEQPWAEAMAISGDSIVYVGTIAGAENLAGIETKRTITDTASLIVPGFIDSHTHFLDGGYSLSSVQLPNANSPAEFIKILADFAKTLKPGVWITGGNWDHQRWGGILPERDWIDSVTKDNPVWVNRSDGHMHLTNSAALKAAGVTDQVKNVDGGEIIRKNGRMTGLLKDNANSLIAPSRTPRTAEEEDKALQAAMDYVASNGVTSVVSVTGTGYGNYIDVYRRALASNQMKTRIYAAGSLEDWRLIDSIIKKNGRGDDWLKLGAVKGFVDGSLGSHTAAFVKPFSDSPKDSGIFLIPEAILYQRIKSADSAGLQLMIHAIGDKSIHTLLNLFERIKKEEPARDRRIRMEHAQHILPEDIPRFAKLDVIASMQPYHAIDDGRWAEKVIGQERAKTTYAFRSLLDAGTKMAFGSDWFVAPASPLLGIYAAVTRRTIDEKNPNGWIPAQKIRVEEAMKAYTLGAAYASSDEQRKGSLQKGKLADYVVLDKDITEINPREIPEVRILKTVVGGKLVYDHLSIKKN